MAAHRGGVKHILIPKENEKDIPDIPETVRKALTIESVEHVDEVLKKALVLDDPESLFQKGAELEAAEGGFTKPEDSPGDVVTH